MDSTDNTVLDNSTSSPDIGVNVFPATTTNGPTPGVGLATASLVCGILSLTGGLLFGLTLGVLAIVFGASVRGKIQRGEMHASAGGQAIAGLVLGIVGLCLVPIWFFLGIATFGVCLL